MTASKIRFTKAPQSYHRTNYDVHVGGRVVGRVHSASAVRTYPDGREVRFLMWSYTSSVQREDCVDVRYGPSVRTRRAAAEALAALVEAEGR